MTGSILPYCSGHDSVADGAFRPHRSSLLRARSCSRRLERGKRGAARRLDGDGSTVVDRVRTVSRAQVRQPVNANGLGRWRAYASELAPLIAELEAVESLAGWGA